MRQQHQNKHNTPAPEGSRRAGGNERGHVYKKALAVCVSVFLALAPDNALEKGALLINDPRKHKEPSGWHGLNGPDIGMCELISLPG